MHFQKRAYRTVFRGFKNTSAYRGEGTLLPDQTLGEHYIWLWHLFSLTMQSEMTETLEVTQVIRSFLWRLRGRIYFLHRGKLIHSDTKLFILSQTVNLPRKEKEKEKRKPRKMHMAFMLDATSKTAVSNMWLNIGQEVRMQGVESTGSGCLCVPQ